MEILNLPNTYGKRRIQGTKGTCFEFSRTAIGRNNQVHYL